MNNHIKLQIKENLKNSIRNFFKNKKVKNYQVLDDIFPNERRIRSLIGGLETSLGATFWEPIDIIKFTSPPPGTGVDIPFIKGGIEYIFDVKTT